MRVTPNDGLGLKHLRNNHEDGLDYLYCAIFLATLTARCPVIGQRFPMTRPSLSLSECPGEAKEILCVWLAEVAHRHPPIRLRFLVQFQLMFHDLRLLASHLSLEDESG